MRVFKSFRSIPNRAACVLAGLCLGVVVSAAAAGAGAPSAGTNEDFSALGDAVVRLLQSRDTARFAAETAPTFEDFQAIFSNAAGPPREPPAGLRQYPEQQRQRIEGDAKQLLAKADSLQVDFSKGVLGAQVLPPNYLGKSPYPGIGADQEALPYTDKLEIILRPGADTNPPANGDCKLAMLGLMKFAGGWRLSQIRSLHWVSFPSNIADAKTSLALALVDKAASGKGLTGQDDPALLELGKALVHFIRERDAEIFKQEAFPSADLLWAGFQQAGQKGPSRQAAEDGWKRMAGPQMEIARTTAQQMEDAGIDLKNADIQIQAAEVERLDHPGPSGSVVRLIGTQFKLKLAVKSGGKSKNGTPLTGEYVLAAKQILRFADDWKVVEDVHWQQLPAGVVDGNASAKVEFENYVAQHGTLPPQTPAPEIEFTTLEGGKQMKLSDLRGKVVVLDFWATWCGPCQEPMAQMQTLRQSHPDWQDQVAIVPLSIDDTLKIARDHVDQRGWTNTFNVWAGEGGFESKPAAAFRVDGVPTTYIIDGQGKIVLAGNPSSMGIVNIGRVVDNLLGTGRKTELPAR